MPLTTTLPDQRAATAPGLSGRLKPPLAAEPLFFLAIAVALGHFLVNRFGPYGFQRDELLYLAMGQHLHLWSMDFPPMIALLAEGTRHLLGDSLPAIRSIPLVAHALLVVLAGLLAREFGGGKFAQVLAAFSVALTPLFMRAGNLFQPVILDQLWWTLALFALARIGRSAAQNGSLGDPIAWIGLGVFGGLGLLTKFSIGFLAVGILVALVLSPQRRALLTRWPLEAALLGLIIGSPSIVGQLQLGFPVLPQMRDLQTDQLSHVNYIGFLLGQLQMFGPAMLLAVVGVARLLSSRAYRLVGWTCLATFVLLMVLHGKPYYIGPIYPTLFAAGAAALDLGSATLANRAVGRIAANVVRGLVMASVLLFGAVTLPLGVPFLGPSTLEAYMLRIGVQEHTNTGAPIRIPQDYADMIGWPQEAAAVANVYRSLPPDKKAQAVVMAGNYGQAGAIDLYGPRLGLPRAISPTGSYWFWGPGQKPGNVVVFLGGDSASLAQFFGSVRPVTRMVNPWGVPEEQHAPIFIAEQPKKTLQQLWPSLAGRN